MLTAIIAIAGLALSVVEFEFSVFMANSIVNTEKFFVGNSTVNDTVPGYCNPTNIAANLAECDQGGAYQFCDELSGAYQFCAE